MKKWNDNQWKDFQYFKTTEDIQKHFINGRVAIYVPFLDNAIYFEYLIEIVCLLSKGGATVLVLDSPDTFGIREYQNPKAEIMREHYLGKLCVQTHKVSSQENSLPKRSLVRDLLKGNPELRNSLESVMASQFLRREKFPRYLPLSIKESRRYLQSYLVAKSALTKFHFEYDFSHLIVFNGRWPDQVACKQFALEKDIGVLHLEAGEPRGERFFLQPFQTTDNDSMSQYLMCLSDQDIVMPEIVYEWSTNWLYRNCNDRELNRFLHRGELLESHKIEHNQMVVFFTSSMDEFNTNLGTDLRGWKSQEEAISTIGDKFRIDGVYFLVRIHPNLANKALIECLRLMYELRKSGIPFIAPWKNVSSYDLVDRANLVVTWGSTIGLEAAARGKPVIYAGPSIWERVLKHQQINKRNTSKFILSEIGLLSLDTAYRAIYYSRNWGFEFSRLDSLDINDVGSTPNTRFLKTRYLIFLIRNLPKISANEIVAAFEILFGKELGNRLGIKLLDLLSIRGA